MEFVKKLLIRKKSIATMSIVTGAFMTVMGLTFGKLALSIAVLGVGLFLSGCQIILFGIIRTHLDAIRRQIVCLQSAISLLRVPLKPPVSFSQHAAYPDLIEIIAEIMRRRPIHYVVELGCGISSRYIVSLLVQLDREGELICLEDNPAWLNLVQSELDSQLDSVKTVQAKIIHAPLVLNRNKHNELPFYDLDKIKSGVRPGIDLLIIDGPWDVKARELAFVYLREFLSETAVIVLDDGDSPVISSVVSKWCAGSNLWHQIYYPTVKGTYIISQDSKSLDLLPFP
jgi:hypothetical protein